jgi:polyphosphate kinase 2 (PPK2 family)
MGGKSNSSFQNAQLATALPYGSNGRSAVAEVKVPKPLRLSKDCDYDRELRRLQIELVKLQEWIRLKGSSWSCCLKAVTLRGRVPAGASETRPRIGNPPCK